MLGFMSRSFRCVLLGIDRVKRRYFVRFTENYDPLAFKPLFGFRALRTVIHVTNISWCMSPAIRIATVSSGAQVLRDGPHA
jgi:hypothetical protein